MQLHETNEQENSVIAAISVRFCEQNKQKSRRTQPNQTKPDQTKPKRTKRVKE